MGSLLGLDLLYTDLPDPLEPGFDIHVWNQAGLHTDERYHWWVGTHLHRVSSDDEKVTSCLLAHRAAKLDEPTAPCSTVEALEGSEALEETS